MAGKVKPKFFKYFSSIIFQIQHYGKHRGRYKTTQNWLLILKRLNRHSVLSPLGFDIRDIKTEEIRYNLFLELKYWSIETRKKSCSHQCISLKCSRDLGEGKREEKSKEQKKCAWIRKDKVKLTDFEFQNMFWSNLFISNTDLTTK